MQSPKGFKDNAPVPQQGGDNYNVNHQQMDVEFQKHILDINPLLAAFNCAFSGWRIITIESEKELFGKSKEKKKTIVKIDYYSRFINESGTNFIFNSVMPLIAPMSSTSHVRPIDIYNYWNGHLLTIETTLLDSYYIPTYVCSGTDCDYFSYNQEELYQHMQLENHSEYVPESGHASGSPYMCNGQECNFVTANALYFRDHKRNSTHTNFTKSLNPFQLNMERYPNIVTGLAVLSIITMKAKEGFTLKELAESFLTSNIIKSGQAGQLQPQVGILQRMGL